MDEPASFVDGGWTKKCEFFGPSSKFLKYLDSFPCGRNDSPQANFGSPQANFRDQRSGVGIREEVSAKPFIGREKMESRSISCALWSESAWNIQ